MSERRKEQNQSSREIDGEEEREREEERKEGYFYSRFILPLSFCGSCSQCGKKQ